MPATDPERTDEGYWQEEYLPPERLPWHPVRPNTPRNVATLPVTPSLTEQNLPTPPGQTPAQDELPRRKRNRRRAGTRRRKGIPLGAEIALCVVSAIIIAILIRAFAFQIFVVPSGSMEPTFEVGDRVSATVWDWGPFEVQRGDIVVFSDPGGWTEATKQPWWRKAASWIGLTSTDEHLTKRVIALGGDHVTSTGNGDLSINGVKLNETYLPPGVSGSNVPIDVIVPEGEVYVLGDNRENSLDSRFHPDHPTVPLSDIVGVVTSRIYPLDRITMFTTPSRVYAGVPEPGGDR